MEKRQKAEKSLNAKCKLKEENIIKNQKKKSMIFFFPSSDLYSEM